MHFRRKLRLAICLALALIPMAPASAVAAPAGLTEQEVSFTSGEITLHGTILAPAGAAQRNRPGMVMVHGSGRTQREGYREEAEAFARAGIVTLIYDKRTGYSKTNRDYSALADDSLAAFEALRARPDVDPAMVGMWGVSEGGWVAPLAASRAPEVAFLVIVGGPGTAPAQQQSWNLANRFADAGVSGSLAKTVTGTGMRVFVGAGLFPEAHYDPVPALAQTHVPLLGLWGEHDRQIPAAESMRVVQDTLGQAGDTHYTLRIVAGADHTMRLESGAVDPAYLELVGSWVNGLAAGPPAASADPAPAQERLSVPIAAPAWYETSWAQLAALAVLLVAFAGYPVSAAWRRLRGRRGTPSVPARWLSATGSLAVVGLFAYFVYLLTSGAKSLGVVVLGRPVPWLVLQLLAVGAVAATAATIAACFRTRTCPPRLAVLLAGGVLFVPWAFQWGLLLP